MESTSIKYFDELKLSFCNTFRVKLRQALLTTCLKEANAKETKLKANLRVYMQRDKYGIYFISYLWLSSFSVGSPEGEKEKLPTRR